ncbi:hypothetical protein TeGR_g12027 [Tetraparma gracilis]|uniref:VOC domain-containing protein n=1 Tax=Tetraparma gracilis TaxID=2962635 RepID=A0ABQ6M3R2_9STRA|nr:hypothetical protein TeGR_g12027 [Tetraparma gracilis]
MHHVGLHVRSLPTSCAFYSLFNFTEAVRFRTGASRACWLADPDRPTAPLLELIEAPPRPPLPKAPRKHPPPPLGLNHLCLDVSPAPLGPVLSALQASSLLLHNRTVAVARQPRQQIVGGAVYELCFLEDPDGGLVELLSRGATLEEGAATEMRW